jgi:iron complex transport system permease protein
VGLLAVAGGLALVALYLLSGRYPNPGLTDPRSLVSDPVAQRVLVSLRLPRALGALLLGAVLGGSGAAFQIVFGNPLVEPGFLGVSQGAAFGAALALVLWPASGWATALSAFVAALLALRLSLWLARRFRFGGQVIRLVLAGIAVSALCSALLAAVKYAADPLSQLPDITFWTMGGLSAMSWPRLALSAPVAVFSLAAILALRWRATILSLDDEASRALGARPELERAVLVVAATAGVAAMTAVCGIVSWAGLVVPHAARILVGSDGRSSIPASMALGALFVLACDLVARNLLPGELPLGIVTALFGTVLFALLLASRRAAVLR